MTMLMTLLWRSLLTIGTREDHVQPLVSGAMRPNSGVVSCGARQTRGGCKGNRRASIVSKENLSHGREGKGHYLFHSSAFLLSYAEDGRVAEAAEHYRQDIHDW